MSSLNNKTVIHFLSASDRLNFGDLLFPLIFKEVNKLQDEFINYGIVKSDLRHFGALPTKSYFTLRKNTRRYGGKLVIGGGEVFFADWNTLFGFINPHFRRLMYNSFLRKIESKIKFSQKILNNNKIAIPFNPSKLELKNNDLKIFYSSVGGGNVSARKGEEVVKIKKALNEAFLLSVRDKRTQTALKKLGCEPSLIPDSAILMSDVFSQDHLFSNKNISSVFSKGRYIFLQLGRFKGPPDLKKFGKDILALSKTLGMKIILCPIGKAPGHEDDFILKELKKIYPEFEYCEPKNIYDIMYLISNSSLFIGTSLHGIIAAQSYNVPLVGLNKRLIKVDSYIKTWINKEMTCLNFDQINEIGEIFATWNFREQESKLAIQKKMVRENFAIIMNS